jgi:hypothetical protein
MTAPEFTTNDIVMVDAENIVSIARVRSFSDGRLHIALEHGGFIRWTESPVTVRRCNDLTAPVHGARIVHASTATATLEMIPTPNDTERDVASYAVDG